MNAKILIEYTVEYTVKNVCNREDYGKDRCYKTFADLVNGLIESEGIYGIAEDKFRIVSIKHSK